MSRSGPTTITSDMPTPRRAPTEAAVPARRLGALLDENWRLKAQLTAAISDAQIDGWYAAGLAHGALGGKLLGAGNGGFLMFYAPAERHDEIAGALPGLQPVKFHFDRNGAQIVFFQPHE